MALGIDIDQKRPMAESCEAGGQIDTGRRLPAATFLIDDRDGPHRKTFLGSLAKSPVDPSTGEMRFNCL
jgi:hypothetical protein